MAEVRAHVLISGVVQGVNFRYWTHHEANRRGITGWVRNLPDGRVEALFEGPRTAVEEMVAWCHRGPRSAQVTDVKVRWEAATGEFDEFTVRY